MKLTAPLPWLRTQLQWNRRWSLWGVLLVLVVTLLGALVWLAVNAVALWITELVNR